MKSFKEQLISSLLAAAITILFLWALIFGTDINSYVAMIICIAVVQPLMLTLVNFVKRKVAE